MGVINLAHVQVFYHRVAQDGAPLVQHLGPGDTGLVSPCRADLAIPAFGLHLTAVDGHHQMHMGVICTR